MVVLDTSACPLRVLTSLGVNKQITASDQKKTETHRKVNLESLSFAKRCDEKIVIFCVFMRVSDLATLMYSVLRTEGLVGKRVFDLFNS